MSLKEKAFLIHRLIDGTLSNPAVTLVGGNPRASDRVRIDGRTLHELAAAVETLATSLVEIDELATGLFIDAPSDGRDYLWHPRDPAAYGMGSLKKCRSPGCGERA